MDVLYAETINSFANDLDHLRIYQNVPGDINGNQRDIMKLNENCSLNRFMRSAASKCSEQTNASKTLDDLTDRLAKTASIWTRPELSRMEADEILMEFEKGIFIVRMTTDQKTMVLSYRAEDKVQHVMIKVDVTKGFFMDGSQNIFRNVNKMISHYMTHPLQGRNLFLKLPRALKEATEPMHFKFFENLKLDFWKTSLANKSITDIWGLNKSLESKDKQISKSNKEESPPLPPRTYEASDLNIIQGLADEIEPEEIVYNKIKKKEKKESPPSQIPKRTPVRSKPEHAYSNLWNWSSDTNKPIPNIDNKPKDTKKIANSNIQKNKVKTLPQPNLRRGSKDKLKKQNTDDSPLIRDLVEIHFPQIIKIDYRSTTDKITISSLTDDIMKIKERFCSKSEPQAISYISSHSTDGVSSDSTYENQYETPWDVQTPWITKLMNMNSCDPDGQSKLMSEVVKASTLEFENQSRQSFVDPFLMADKDNKSNKNKLVRLSTVSYTDDDDDEDEDPDRINLKQELLKEIQPVMLSPQSTYAGYNQKNFKFGKSIRDYLIQLCSSKSEGDISNSIRMFIQCTIERTDLSPYTTMRLIRQYMSGLKNLIKQQQQELGILTIIEEERKQTPKNVFINLDSIMESVLTKVVLKPLTGYIYRLLVLEHYKNNNLKLIANGIEVAKYLPPEKLGLENFSIEIINSKIHIVKKKFISLSKTYSPEKKIGHLISVIEIVFQIIKLIYPDIYSESKRSDIKTDKLLSILVYIFSQCKQDAISTQCEVEYIEGVIWSSSLVNGEPGFYLMNLMSSLEAIKVLSRPEVRADDFIDLTNNNPNDISNSRFYNKINPSSISTAAMGSVNVIILDEKINRLVTKTFPVRSTTNSRALSNTIAHRLGIFNPMEYSLYKFTGIEEILLQDLEIPLVIKQMHQQSTGETLNFLFRRKNATFILPNII